VNRGILIGEQKESAGSGGFMKESYGDFVSRMFNMVKTHMNWDDEKTNLWFRTENPLLGNIEPDDFMQRRPQKFEKWVKALISDVPKA